MSIIGTYQQNLDKHHGRKTCQTQKCNLHSEIEENQVRCAQGIVNKVNDKTQLDS